VGSFSRTLDQCLDVPLVDGDLMRRFVGEIFVLVLLTPGHHEVVPFFPFEMALAHGSSTPSLENMVEGGAGVSMYSSFFPGFEKLDLAGHRRIGESARGGIDVAEQGAIVWIALAVAHRL